MAITIDSRMHVMGDLVMVSGTYTDEDATFSLADHLSEILSVTMNAATGVAAASAGIDGTNILLVCGSAAGKFTALGKR